MSVDTTDGPLLDALVPEVERLTERHLAATKEWFPHEVVPWSRGRDFTEHEDWDPNEVVLSDAVRSALVVNLLTEDNLPYYFRTIEHAFGADGAWGFWARRWTAEEGRHSIAIRDYLTVTRAVDPISLERDRMAQVTCGEVPIPQSAADGLAYVALQELATRISHFATGKAINDPAGYNVMKRVAADENLHYLFYRDLVTAAMQLDPSTMMLAIERQVREFEMPGTGIANFAHHALAIAKAGIYDLQIHHDQILEPVVLKHWGVEHVEGLSPEAEEARASLVKRIDRIGRAGRRIAARWAEQDAGAAAAAAAPSPLATAV